MQGAVGRKAYIAGAARPHASCLMRVAYADVQCAPLHVRRRCAALEYIHKSTGI